MPDRTPHAKMHYEPPRVRLVQLDPDGSVLTCQKISGHQQCDPPLTHKQT